MSTHSTMDTSGYARIIVPLDGSSLSESALPVATTIARSSHGTLYLARVHVPIIGAVDAGFAVPDWEDEIRESERTYLAGVARQLSTDHAIQVETRLLDGPVGGAIKDLIEEVRASLLVITTHGRTGLSRTWLGSTADWLVRFAPVPVMLVRPPDELTSRELSMKHVLIALDGSERAERLIPEVARIGRALGARFTLLRVVQPVARFLATYGAPTLPQVRDEQGTSLLLHHAKDYLDGIAKTFRRELGDPAPSTEVVASDRTADAILQRAHELGAHVIALSTRGRGASRLLVGSVADKVLRGFTGVVFALGPVALRELESDEIVVEPESRVPDLPLSAGER